MHKEYRTVCGEYTDILDCKVNLLLQEGWELYGNLHSDRDGYLFQALVKIIVDEPVNKS